MASVWADVLEPTAFQCETPPPEDLLKIAFYNVGVSQRQLRRQSKNFDKHMRRFAHDIEETFVACRADVLCICELGEHLEGLEDQEGLLKELVGLVNSDARELAGSLRVLTACHPTYAVIVRNRPSLKFLEVSFVHWLDDGLDASRHLDRTALVMVAEFQGRKLTVINVHCPSSTKRPYTGPVRARVFASLMYLVGATRGGAAEPAGWIIGGDLNCGEN